MSESSITASFKPISSNWRKAAVLGSVWAAFEILWGGFLHSLKIPFAGMILASGGVLLLAAGRRLWPEKGLAWRAALVCTLLKSISPSAVILGPMVGILMEGLLVEVAFRIMGGNRMGAALAGALAVCWTLAQKILGLFLLYGLNLAVLYVEFCRYAARTLGLESLTGIDLLAAAFAIQSVVGVTAGLAGWRLGGESFAAGHRSFSAREATFFSNQLLQNPGAHNPVLRLGLLLGFLIITLSWLPQMPLWAGALATAAYCAVIAAVYPQMRKRLSRPRLWAEMGLVLLSAAALLGKTAGGARSWQAGLAAGFLMIQRAAIMIAGFSAASCELRNPRILGRLKRHGFRSLLEALNLAFGALPGFISAVSELRTCWRRPSRCMRELIGLAVAAVGRQAPAVFFITGEKGEGKTTLLVEIVKHLRAHGIQVGGIAACAVSEAGLRVGFDVMNVASGERRPLARLKTGEGRNLTSGKYEFFQDGLRMGRKALSSARRAGSQVVVVDEVGPLELGGHGWAANLDELLAQPVIQIWVVRRGLLEQVKAHWGLSPAGVFRVARTSPEEVFSAIEAVLFETEEPEVTASVTTAAAGPGLKSSGWQLKST